MSPKLVSIAVALLVSAYITWVAVTKGGDGLQLTGVAFSWRRLQSDERRLCNWKCRRRRRNKNKNNNNNKSSSSSNNKNTGNSNNNSGGGSSGGDSATNAYLNKDHDKWLVKGNQGLQVKVWNNFKAGSAWTVALRTAVSEWNQSPFVQMSMSRPSFDRECSAVAWQMKACNGNYGETGWKGVNHAYLHNGHIVASIIKMNDSYSTGTTAKQYTACHEVGHALGLKHSDEEFGNKDLYDCMDYTHKYENNKSPGALNFLALKKLYGSTRRALRAGKMNPGIEEMVMDEEVEKLFYETLEKVDTDESHDGIARKLAEAGHGTVHEEELENGFTLRTTVLHAKTTGSV